MSEKTQETDFKTKKDNITNKDKKALKDDIIFFKEEILKHMNSLEKSFAEQKEEIRAKINGKFILYDETLEKLNTNFSELKKIVEINKYIKEQVDNWSHFKNDISKISTENNVKLTLLEKENYNNFFRIDKLLSSIIYPRVIGDNSKFKTFHDYIDYTLTHISSFDIFKTKIELDLKSYKEKVEKIIQMIKFKIDCSIRDTRQIVKNGIQENEVIIKDYIAGKIFDLQEKNKEFEEKTEKNFEELNIGLNNFDERTKFFNDKVNEKINLNLDKFKEEKETIINDINECKNKNDELIKRINNLEKYNEIQEKKDFLARKTYKQRKKGDNNLNFFPGNNQGFDFINHNNKENYKNNENIMNKNNDLNLASIEEEKSKQINHGNDKLNKSKDNLNNSVDIYNDNRVKLNKISNDKKLLTVDGNTNTNESKKGKNNNQKGLKSNRSLYKLGISLKDINAQFNLNYLKDNNNINNIYKYKRENSIQTSPMTTKISNKIINFDEILSYIYKNRFKYLFEPRTTRFPLHIKNKEIKNLYDDNDIKNCKNNDILTEGIYYKNKNNKNEEHKKTWERLLSPKKKRKSEINILDTYLVNFRSFKKNKTLNRMHLSNSSKNFLSHFFKSDKNKE